MIELGYRLAVSEEPYIRQIRDNVIVSIAPTTDLDGRDRAVDWYYAYKIDELSEGGENYGGPPYWGKYVFHDNNRDINYGVDSLRAHLNWYLQLGAADLARPARSADACSTPSAASRRRMRTSIRFSTPSSRSSRPTKSTSSRRTACPACGTSGSSTPGRLGISASPPAITTACSGCTRSSIRAARTRRRPASRAARRRASGIGPNPAPVGEVDWSIRNSVNYAVSGVLTALELTSKFPQMVVENFYKKTVNSIQAGQTKAPYAFVIPAGQKDQTAGRSRRQSAAASGDRGPSRHGARPRSGKETVAAGSYIVKLNQPYGRLAKTLLEKQTYPDPNLRTYDDSAWTMGLASNIDVKTIDDKAILDAPAQLLSADVETQGHRHRHRRRVCRSSTTARSI